jgi:hypothetical protein
MATVTPANDRRPRATHEKNTPAAIVLLERILIGASFELVKRQDYDTVKRGQ